MSRTSRAEWAKRVQRWRDSGLTAREFAAEAGLNPSTLSYWSWRLNADKDVARDAKISRSARSPRRSAKLQSHPSFVEVSPLAAMTTSAAMLEVVLESGAVVRVPSGFDEATLSRVVRALEAAR